MNAHLNMGKLKWNECLNGHNDSVATFWTDFLCANKNFGIYLRFAVKIAAVANILDHQCPAFKQSLDAPRLSYEYEIDKKILFQKTWQIVTFSMLLLSSLSNDLFWVETGHISVAHVNELNLINKFIATYVAIDCARAAIFHCCYFCSIVKWRSSFG